MAASIRVVRTLHDVIGLKAAVDCVTNLLEKNSTNDMDSELLRLFLTPMGICLIGTSCVAHANFIIGIQERPILGLS